MNFATQRPYQSFKCPVTFGVMWYECQYDGWGAQHDCGICQYTGDDGRQYQVVSYMDPDVDQPDPDLVIHGPAPKSWVDQSDFREVIADFLTGR